MAVTLIEENVIELTQSQALVLGTVQFDSTYPSGGEVIDAPGDRDYSKFAPAGCATGGYVPVYDPAAKKLKMYSPTTAQATGMTETSTTDLSAQIVHFMAIRPT